MASITSRRSIDRLPPRATKRRDRLLAPDKYATLSGNLKIELVTTPWDKIEPASPSWPVRQALAVMDTHHYDQLVVSVDGRHGLVERNVVEHRDSSGPIGPAVWWSSPSLGIAEDALLMKGLSLLCDRAARLVYRGDQAVGLVHRSDFNRQPVRLYFYLWLSALEMGLGELTRREGLDDDEVLDCVENDRTRKLVASRIAGDEEQRLDLDAVHYLDLKDLLRVAQKTSVYSRLGWNDRANGSLGQLVKFRHSVMHPVKVLVTDHDVPGRLLKYDGDLRRFVGDVSRVLGA